MKLEKDLIDNSILLTEFEEYLEAQGFGKTHYFNIKKFLTFCENSDIKVGELNYTFFNKYLLYLQKSKYDRGYINNLIKAVKSFYKFAIDSGKVDIAVLDTLSKFKLLTVPRKERLFISERDFLDLVGNTITFIKRPSPIKVESLLYFMYYSGIRLSELINLKRVNIDLDMGIAHIKLPTKNKIERPVLIPLETKIKKNGQPIFVANKIREYFMEEEEYINAFNVTHRSIRYLFKRMDQFLPVGQHITPHTLRHSYGFLLASKEFREIYAQDYLGHKSPLSTRQYYHINLDILIQAYREKIG